MTLLVINQSSDFDKSIVINLDDTVGNMLFNHCQPVFERTMTTESFWLDDYQTLYHSHNVIDFSDLSDDVFMKVYDLIDDFKGFKIHKQEIVEMMKQDPRFKPS